MISRLMLPVAMCAAAFSTAAISQQIIYPAKGQSPQQQKKDEAECYAWAKQQTGFDPAAPQQAQAGPSKPAAGGVAKGAVAGAAVGAIGGNDVGNAAAKGAVLGGVARRAKNRGAQQQASAQKQQQQQNFQRAYGACVTGRGYTVK